MTDPTFAPMPAPAPADPAPPVKRKSRLRRFLVPTGTLVLGIIIGSTSSGSAGSRPVSAAAPAAPSTVTRTVTAPAAAPVTQTVTAEPPAPQGVGPGTHVVGSEVQPGTYKTTGPANAWMPSCYYARLSDLTGGLGSVNDNGLPDGPTTIEILPTDKAFKTSGCAPWVKVG